MRNGCSNTVELAPFWSLNSLPKKLSAKDQRFCKCSTGDSFPRPAAYVALVLVPMCNIAREHRDQPANSFHPNEHRLPVLWDYRICLSGFRKQIRLVAQSGCIQRFLTAPWISSVRPMPMPWPKPVQRNATSRSSFSSTPGSQRFSSSTAVLAIGLS